MARFIAHGAYNPAGVEMTKRRCLRFL